MSASVRLLLLFAVLPLACTTEAPTPCGGRLADGGRCPREDCLRVRGEYVITGDRGCYFGHMNALTDLADTGGEVCVDATTAATGGGTQTYCRRLTPNLTLAVRLSSYAHRVPAGYYPCLSATGTRLTTYFPTDCPPVCGNGLIEPGEECDGTNLGAPADCAYYFAMRQVPAEGVTGTLGCTADCRRDLSGCVFPE